MTIFASPGSTLCCCQAMLDLLGCELLQKRIIVLAKPRMIARIAKCPSLILGHDIWLPHEASRARNNEIAPLSIQSVHYITSFILSGLTLHHAH